MRRAVLGPPALLLLVGCATYHPRPLDPAVDAGLEAAPLDSVTLAVADLHHPLLAPLEFDPSDGLSPEEAGVLAVVANPRLQAERTRRGLATAEVIRAGLLPNPQLSASADVPVGDEPGATTATGLGLSFDLNALFTRGPEKAAARAQERSVHLDLAWQEWQVAQEARLQTYRLVFLQRQLEVARKEEAALRTNRDQVERAAAEQLVTEARRAAAADAYRTARETRLQMEGEVETARQKLVRLLGQPPSARIPVQTRGVPFLPPDPAEAGADTSDLALPGLTALSTLPEDSLVARLQRGRLDLVALRMGYESQEQSLRAAVRRSFPPINLGVNRLVDTSQVLTWGPALTLDLPFFDRNQGEIATGRARREQLRAEYVARVFAARADVADLRQRIEHLRRRLVNAEAALPERRHLAEVYGEALKEGAVDALLYYDARSRRTEKELEVLRLRQDLAELTVGLETATGGIWTLPTAAGGDR